MVKWLRFCLPMRGAWIQSPVRELRFLAAGSLILWGVAKNLKEQMECQLPPCALPLSRREDLIFLVYIGV